MSFEYNKKLIRGCKSERERERESESESESERVCLLIK
jgi:hypothetical protein